MTNAKPYRHRFPMWRLDNYRLVLGQMDYGRAIANLCRGQNSVNPVWDGSLTFVKATEWSCTSAA